MYQDIAVARGPTYDTLNARMDKCQQNIETMSDDIQRLQVKHGLVGIESPDLTWVCITHVNVQANLADEEMRQEEERIDELTRREDYERARAEIRARRAEEERRAAEERRFVVCGS